MHGRAAVVGAVTALSVAAVMGVSGVAAADITLPSVLPVPSVTVPPVPSTAPTVPGLPVPTSAAPSVPPAAGGGGGGSGSGSAPTGGAAAGSTAGTTTSPSAAGQPATAARKAKSATRKKAAPQINPVIAGRPGAADVVDDEATPALYKATKAFLTADQQIAALATLRDQTTAAKSGAGVAAARYKGLQLDIDNLRAQADAYQKRGDTLRRMLVSDARTSYQTGRPATSDQDARDLAAAAGRADDAASRAEMQLAGALDAQNQARAQFDQFAATYNLAKDRLAAINTRLQALAQQRSAALTAARQATPADQALHRQTLEESGALGAQIRSAVAQLAASGRTITGTGHFIRPSSGVITSPFGQRFHPILHYVKLHTGTDFAVGDGLAHAADDGRVLFTLVSRAYGNFTVIDHGVIDGRHITTAYAHQAKFLVKPGQAVKKGEVIGVIGATGYATGPHLHFEVRDNGAVENPMTWLSR
ncbi:MAG: M23 family metallopeptidase [Actinomycetes bacterium]